VSKKKATATKRGGELNIVDLLAELEKMKNRTGCKTDHPACDEALRLFNKAENRKGPTTARLHVENGVFVLYAGGGATSDDPLEPFWKDANAQHLAMILVGQDTTHLADEPLDAAVDKMIAGSENGPSIPFAADATDPYPVEKADNEGLQLPPADYRPQEKPPAFTVTAEEIADRTAVNAALVDRLARKIINPLPANLKTLLIEIPIGRRPSVGHVSQHVDLKFTRQEADALADIAAGLRAAEAVTPEKGKIVAKPADVIRYLVAYACIAVEAAGREINSDE